MRAGLPFGIRANLHWRCAHSAMRGTNAKAQAYPFSETEQNYQWG